MTADDVDMLSGMQDRYDTMAKAGNLLCVAHGAGIVGCFAFLREKSTLTLPADFSVNLFIILFAIGLMSATFGYGCAALARITIIGDLMGDETLSAGRIKVLNWSAMGGLLFSMLQLYAVLWGLMWVGLWLK